MEKEEFYNQLVEEQLRRFWEIPHLSTFTPAERSMIQDAQRLATEAHSGQRRKSGEPYIIHPIAVASIVAGELQLGANPIAAAFLHDVVEDTPHTIEEIASRFGSDVAFLVGTVTKEKKERYEMSKQLDNFKQMLDSIHYDIRALLVKLADRLHNMRTLSSMKPDKQMKIAGETDYFYAPLANRLGLHEVKQELENLSMRYRCPHEYRQLEQRIDEYRRSCSPALGEWAHTLQRHLQERGIDTVVSLRFRSVYSIWRRMKSEECDFRHLSKKHFIEVVFSDNGGFSEKDRCLQIYSALTDLCKEMPYSLHNYVDSPKENGYQALHLHLLDTHGEWNEVHIASARMMYNSRMGCITERSAGVKEWITKFRAVLREIVLSAGEGSFIERVVDNFYNDDILVFTPHGAAVVLPKNATALDFAFEIHTQLGMHAQFARINGTLCSVKTPLHRGDCIEIGTNHNVSPAEDWLDGVITYKAKRHIATFLKSRQRQDDEQSRYRRCPHCHPLPGDEVIGFKTGEGDDAPITLHKRNCTDAIKLASQRGDSIVDVEFKEGARLYPVSIGIRAVDRYHLLIDLIHVITDTLHLSIDSLTTVTTDQIVDCTTRFYVHSVQQVNSAIEHINAIQGVDEVKCVVQE